MSDLRNQLALYPISDRDLIQVTGPDSAKFMQGQFTCNLKDIHAEQFRRGACCTPKGRMITSFTLAQTGEHAYLLAMSKGLGEISLNHLNKYRVFFKTQLTSSDWVMAGLSGERATEVLETLFGKAPTADFTQVQNEIGIALKLPFDAGFELWLHPDHASATLDKIAAQAETGSSAQWQSRLIAAGLGHVSVENSDELIPQMLNLGQTGGISFNKGCYTGQEIVARMQYLGKLKRHLYRVEFQSSEAPACHTEIHSPEKNSAVGHLVNIAPVDGSDNRFQALAVVEDTALENVSTLSIAQCSDLQLLDLPYEVVPASTNS